MTTKARQARASGGSGPPVARTASVEESAADDDADRHDGEGRQRRASRPR